MLGKLLLHRAADLTHTRFAHKNWVLQECQIRIAYALSAVAWHQHPLHPHGSTLPINLKATESSAAADIGNSCLAQYALAAWHARLNADRSHEQFPEVKHLSHQLVVPNYRQLFHLQDHGCLISKWIWKLYPLRPSQITLVFPIAHAAAIINPFRHFSSQIFGNKIFAQSHR